MKQKTSLKFTLFLISLFLIPAISFSQGKYLLVLDVQEQFIKDKPYEDAAGLMITNVNSLIAGFEKERILYVKSAGKALVINSKGFSTDTLPAPDFDPRLSIVSDNLFVKVSTGDAFTSAELMDFLRSRNAREIVITGLLAEKCITATALGGIERGFDIFLVPEAVVGKSGKTRTRAIGKLEKKGIKIIPMKEAFNFSAR